MQPQGDHLDHILGGGDIAAVDGYRWRPEWLTLARLDDGPAQHMCDRVALIIGLQTRGMDSQGAAGRSDNPHRQLPVQAAREDSGRHERAYGGMPAGIVGGVDADGWGDKTMVLSHRSPCEVKTAVMRFPSSVDLVTVGTTVSPLHLHRPRHIQLAFIFCVYDGSGDAPASLLRDRGRGTTLRPGRRAPPHRPTTAESADSKARTPTGSGPHRSLPAPDRTHRCRHRTSGLRPDWRSRTANGPLPPHAGRPPVISVIFISVPCRPPWTASCRTSCALIAGTIPTSNSNSPNWTPPSR